MSKQPSGRGRNRFALQLLAFALIMLTPCLLYPAAMGGHTPAAQALLGLLGLGMLLALWAS